MALEFADLEKLPDDVMFELPDGRKIKLGEVRDAASSHVNKRISDLTPREQKLVTRENELVAREKAVRDTLSSLANNPPPRVVDATPPGSIPLGYTAEQWAAINADPYSRPIVQALAHMATELEETKRSLSARDTTQAQRDQAEQERREREWIQYQFQQMSATDKRYLDPAEQAALLEYAKEVLTRRDLTVLDRARNYETRMETAKTEAYERGLKEGKSQSPVPVVPYGTRQVTPPGEPVKLPASYNEFVDSAVNDPDLIKDMREAATSPNPPQ